MVKSSSNFGSNDGKGQNVVSMEIEADVDKGGKINLLSDVGLAIRKSKLKKRLFAMTGIVIAITALLNLSVFGFWFWVKKENNLVEDQLRIFEQRLSTLFPVEQTARMYKERLSRISRLTSVEDSNSLPENLLQKMLLTAETVSGSLTQLELKQSEFQAGFRISGLDKLDNLLQAMRDGEKNGLWESVFVISLSRTGNLEYDVILTALLN